MTIDILTPPDYDESKEYPLLILNDGEHMFGNGNWNMDIKLEQLILQGEIEPLIAVAIHSNGMRNNWYVPYEDSWITQNWGAYNPQAEMYAANVINEVMPFVDDKYPFDTSRVGIIGASLGGLISTWMGLKYPNSITYSASLSGSFWVADYSIFSEVDASYDNGQKFLFDIGTAEWNYYVPLYTALDNKGVTPGERNFYYEVPDGKHLTFDWVSRIHLPLKAFFGTETMAEPESMEVVLECIQSVTNSSLKFRRMNPILTLSNGIKYSLAHTATYSLISGEAELGSEGSLKNYPSFSARILVQYQSFSEEVHIPKGWCN